MTNPIDRISIDPAVCEGKPCIKGTRIWVSLILDLLASGMSETDVRAEYPRLTREDVLAAIAYGAEAARVQVIPVPVKPTKISAAAESTFSDRAPTTSQQFGSKGWPGQRTRRCFVFALESSAP